MLDVGKPCTSTNGGAPGVPRRRLKIATSRPSLAAVVDRQRSSAPPFCHSAKMSKPPASQRGPWLDNDAANVTTAQRPGVPAVTRSLGWPFLPASPRQRSGLNRTASGGCRCEAGKSQIPPRGDYSHGWDHRKAWCTWGLRGRSRGFRTSPGGHLPVWVTPLAPSRSPCNSCRSSSPEPGWPSGALDRAAGTDRIPP